MSRRHIAFGYIQFAFITDKGVSLLELNAEAIEAGQVVNINNDVPFNKIWRGLRQKHGVSPFDYDGLKEISSKEDLSFEAMVKLLEFSKLRWLVYRMDKALKVGFASSPVIYKSQVGATMYWLRDLVWLMGADILPGLFKNEAAFKKTYPVIIAWWLEGVLAYALSSIFGGNLFTAWGIFMAGHVLDFVFNIFRTKGTRVSLLNTIIAAMVSSISIVMGWVAINPLSWFVHGGINLAFYAISYCLLRHGAAVWFLRLVLFLV